MKNKINTAFLTVLMLFATLYPSGQAYANKNNNHLITEIAKIDLAKKLVKDKDYANYLQLLIYPILYNSFIKINSSNNNFNAANEKSEILFKKKFNDFGFLDENNYKSYLNDLNSIINNLISKYPIILKLNDEDIKEVYDLTLKNNSFKEILSNSLDTSCSNQCFQTFLQCAGAFDKITYLDGLTMSLLTINCVTAYQNANILYRPYNLLAVTDYANSTAICVNGILNYIVVKIGLVSVGCTAALGGCYYYCK